MSLLEPSHERRIRRLEKLAGESEALQPNYLSYNPVTGVITANFSGVFTGSLILPEAVNTSPISPTSAVAWQDAGKVNREYIQGVNEVGVHFLWLACQPDTNDTAVLFTEAQPAGPAGSAIVEASAQDSTSGVSNVVIINSQGGSSFLFRGRGTNTKPWFVDSGQVTVAVAANAANGSAPVTFNAPFTNAPDVTLGLEANVLMGPSISTGTIGITGFTAVARWFDGALTHGAANPIIHWVAVGN